MNARGGPGKSSSTLNTFLYPTTEFSHFSLKNGGTCGVVVRSYRGAASPDLSTRHGTPCLGVESVADGGEGGSKLSNF